MRRAVIGASGYLGSQIKAEKGYNSQNLLDSLKEEWDEVVIAAPSSSKFEINKELKVLDISNLLTVIKKIKTKELILLSSISALTERGTIYGDTLYQVLTTVETRKDIKTRTLIIPNLVAFDTPKGLIRDLLNKTSIYIKHPHPEYDYLGTDNDGQDWYKAKDSCQYDTDEDFWPDKPYPCVLVDDVVKWVETGEKPEMELLTKSEIINAIRNEDTSSRITRYLGEANEVKTRK